MTIVEPLLSNIAVSITEKDLGMVSFLSQNNFRTAISDRQASDKLDLHDKTKEPD